LVTRSEAVMPQESSRIGLAEAAAFLASRNGLGIPRCETLSAIVRNGAIDDRAAVDAFPCVENEKEIREAFQHHQAFALRTFH